MGIRPNANYNYLHKIFPNLLKQNFQVEKPNQVWCTDFTYLFLSNGNVRYNCSIIDMYDRSVVASTNGRWISSKLAIVTIEKALKTINADPHRLILHGDQGKPSGNKLEVFSGGGVGGFGIGFTAGSVVALVGGTAMAISGMKEDEVQSFVYSSMATGGAVGAMFTGPV